MTLVREAMVTDPKALDASASAQEAAERLTRPEVRAVLVVDGDRLVGVVTDELLVERSSRPDATRARRRSATWRSRVTLTALPDMLVEDAYRLMESEDVERLPVTDDGRLVGVLSRSALTRRLAEDEPPDREDDRAL